MARKVFFSFHYDRDIHRAEVVRNSDITKEDYTLAGYIDASSREEFKKGDDAIKRWILKELEGTSVTVILVGNQTYKRSWVRYEIQKSFERGNGLLSINITNIKDLSKQTDIAGPNPLSGFYYTVYSTEGLIGIWELLDNQWKPSGSIPTNAVSYDFSSVREGTFTKISAHFCDWKLHDGYTNFGKWVEAAAKLAGK